MAFNIDALQTVKSDAYFTLDSDSCAPSVIGLMALQHQPIKTS